MCVCVCLIGSGLERSTTNDATVSEIQDGAGFANSEMHDRFSDSELQYGSGVSRVKTSNSQGESLTSYALHCDQPETELHCTRNESKTKVVDILRCLHRLTDRQKKRIKDLLCRFEQSSDVNCTSNCELICKNTCYKNSNIYELICYSIHKICREPSTDDDSKNYDGHRVMLRCRRKDGAGDDKSRLKRNRDDVDYETDSEGYDVTDDTEDSDGSEESSDQNDESEESDGTESGDGSEESSDQNDESEESDGTESGGCSEENDDRNDESQDESTESGDRNESGSEETDGSRCTSDDNVSVVWECLRD